MIRSLQSIFCDDVRQELGLKLSYMGCYTGQMFVHTLPLSLPKLCVAMHATTPADNPFGQIRFRLLKNDELLAEAEMNISELPKSPLPLVQFPGDELRMMIAQVFQLSPFHLTEPCILRARVITEDGEELKGGSLAIAVAPPQMLVGGSGVPAPGPTIEDPSIRAAQILDTGSLHFSLPDAS